MSEYECANKHEILPSEGTCCKICGLPVHYEDGLSSWMIRRIKELEDYAGEDEEEEKE